MGHKFSDLEKEMSRQSIRRSDKEHSGLTRTIFKTTHDMREAGIMDEETHSRIVARHRKEK
jgi:hypothetical protein